MNEDPASPYAAELGHRLRAIRQQQGLSLHGVETSRVTAGRRLSSARTSAATGPSRYTGWPSSPTSTACRWRGCCPVPNRVATIPRPAGGWSSISGTASPTDRAGPAADPLHRGHPGPARRLQRRVLSIREDDIRSLCLLYDTSPGGLFELLESWNIVASYDGFGRRIGAQRESSEPMTRPTVDISARGQQPRSRLRRLTPRRRRFLVSRSDAVRRQLGQDAVDEAGRLVGRQRLASSTASSIATASGMSGAEQIS